MILNYSESFHLECLEYVYDHKQAFTLKLINNLGFFENLIYVKTFSFLEAFKSDGKKLISKSEQILKINKRILALTDVENGTLGFQWLNFPFYDMFYGKTLAFIHIYAILSFFFASVVITWSSFDRRVILFCVKLENFIDGAYLCLDCAASYGKLKGYVAQK